MEGAQFTHLPPLGSASSLVHRVAGSGDLFLKALSPAWMSLLLLHTLYTLPQSTLKVPAPLWCFSYKVQAVNVSAPLPSVRGFRKSKQQGKKKFVIILFKCKRWYIQCPKNREKAAGESALMSQEIQSIRAKQVLLLNMATRHW